MDVETVYEDDLSPEAAAKLYTFRLWDSLSSLAIGGLLAIAVLIGERDIRKKYSDVFF